MKKKLITKNKTGQNSLENDVENENLSDKFSKHEKIKIIKCNLAHQRIKNSKNRLMIILIIMQIL